MQAVTLCRLGLLQAGVPGGLVLQRPLQINDPCRVAFDLFLGAAFRGLGSLNHLPCPLADLYGGVTGLDRGGEDCQSRLSVR